MKPYNSIKVIRWKDAVNKEILQMDAYQDDKIDDAVMKIGAYIQQNTPFYTWSNDKPLLFSIKDPKWKGYNVNPFKAHDYESKELLEPISYNYINTLFMHKVINIVFESDLPTVLKKNKYYFPNIKSQTYQQYKKRDEKLATIRNINTSFVKVLPEYYTRANFHVLLKSVSLPAIYDDMHTSKYIDMIQWIDDSSKVLYKLYKKHKIGKEHFGIWTNIDKALKINVINMYSVIHKTSYCKISIDNEGHILFNYFLDHRKYVKWNDILIHKKNIISILQNVVKMPIKLQEISLNTSIKIEVQNSTLKLLSKKISEAIDIFHILSNKANLLTCTYKRSSNYGQHTDIYDYIKARINLGISKQEIIEELVNLGVSGNLQEMIDNEINMLDDVNQNKEQIKLEDNGTILIFRPYPQGYDITIINCPNNTELQYLIFWISHIISSAIGKAPVAASIIPVIAPVIAPSISSSVTSQASSSTSSASINDSSIDFDDLDSLGGAPSKNNNFINLLQQADKDLFAENYARDKCQVNSQPIVFNKEHKEYLEKTNQMHFDNIIEYGSNSKNLNYYACPRLWCPQSKVPLSVDTPDAKCPIDGEKPMQLLWDNDKNKKRYVKLVKPNEKGMCVPCCMKKEPKDMGKCLSYLQNKNIRIDNTTVVSPIQQPVQSDSILESDENYIMNQIAPIPVGRYGNIPEYLMKLLDIKSESCNKMLTKMQSCFVRKGVKHNKSDSIIYSIMDLLGFNTKQDFIKDIKKKLDLTTFISLADGMICKQFMSMREIIPEDNADLLREYNASKKKGFKEGNLSRTLNIYYAYKRYIEYLSSNDFTAIKNPYYLYSLVSALYNIYIIVWEKIDKTKDIYLNCYNTMMDFNPTIGMIMRDGMYYEPIELKLRGTSGTKFLKLNDYPMLKEVVNKCNKISADAISYKSIIVLHNWVKTKLLKNWKNFDIKFIMLNSDLSISSFLTEGNMLLECNRINISLLPNMMKDLDISKENIVFYDDIVGKNFDIRVQKEDLMQFIEKCNSLQIRCNIGNVRKEGEKELYTNLVITEHPLNHSIIIHTNGKNEYYKNLGNIQKKSKRWFELQKMVANTLMKKYSDDWKELREDKQEKVKRLYQMFLGLPVNDLKKIKIILEEIPIDSIASIQKWLSDVIIFAKYDYFSHTPIMKDNEYIFSQNALTIKVPDYLLLSHNALPNIRTKMEEEIPIILKDISKKNDKSPKGIYSSDSSQGSKDSNNSVDMQIPSIFKGTQEVLKSKWIIHKKSRWNNMVFIKCAYTNNTIPEFVTWFMKKIEISGINYDDIQNIAIRKYFDIMNDKELFLEILQDPWYFKKWMQKVDKKFGSVQQFWENYYVNLQPQERKRLTSSILQETRYVNDLDIIAISELLNISILLIHRGKYGKFDASQVRGELDDLKVSSTLFAAKRNMNARPLLIFHKTYEKNNITYNIIVDKNIKKSYEALYLKYDDVPHNIKILTDAHLT
jgi:hypothetical protein